MQARPGWSSEVQCLPSMYKVIGSIPRTAKKKKKPRSVLPKFGYGLGPQCNGTEEVGL
jgi:hypothetical protein